MANDVETLLANLGRTWNASVDHLELDEVLKEVLKERANGLTVKLAPAVNADVHKSGRHLRRRMVACAALVAAIVTMLALINRGDVEQPVVTIVPTTTPTTPTTPTTIVPTTTPTTVATTTSIPPTTMLPETPGLGAWWPVGRPAAECGPCGDSTLLPDGRVVIVGGMSDGRPVIQIYDPPTASFRITGTLPEGVGVDQVVALTDGRLLLTGLNGGGVVIYDPADESVDVIAEGSDSGGAAVQLVDGRVLLFGPTSVQSLDLATGQITRAAGRSTASRAGAPAVAVPLPNGHVLVADHLAADVYDPASGTFAKFGDGSLGVTRALLLSDGRLLLLRSDAEQTTQRTEIYDPSTDTFTPVGTWTPTALLNDGRILALEEQYNPMAVVTAAIHDLTTGNIVPIAMPTGRRFLAEPVVLDDGRVLIFGNYPGNASGPFSTDMTTAELFSFGDSGLPAGCCPPNPQQVALSLTQPDDWTPFVDRPLRFTVTVPAGALDGATRRANWLANWLAGEEDGSGKGGELTLPAGCEGGCEFELPWTITPTPSTTAVYASLVINFDGEPPAAASTIAINVEPTG